MSRSFIIFVIVLVACSSEGPSVPQSDGATTSDATFDVAVVDSRPPGCSSSSECDDGVSCTEDHCESRVCLHRPDAARCGAGQACDDRRGCVAGRACARDEDCADMDPCTVRERCDPSARVCVSNRLDGDSDGEPPRSCGGNDCDDANFMRRPGRPELCDNVDNDCNSMVDDNATGCTAMGSACRAGRCECVDAQRRLCEVEGINACVDTTSDPRACGACGTGACGTGTCVKGECRCTDPSSRCGGTGVVTDPICADLQTARENCGRCGVRCPAGTDCVRGSCTCPMGSTYCTTTTPPGCFVPAEHQSDDMNCGACGVRCQNGLSCQAGRCVCAAAGDTQCGDRCVSLRVSSDHCGACGRACPRGVTCREGMCGCFDVRVNTICPSGCADLQRDPMNCGRCGRVCPPVQGMSERRTCSDGQCVCLDRSASGLVPMYHCPSAMGSDVCVDVLIDTSNCGRCGNVCRAGESCISGSCVCPDARCGDRCGVNLMTDNSNCGACGTICAAGTTCQSGRCAAVCPMFCAGTADCAPCLPPAGFRSCCVRGLCLPLAMCP